MVTERTPPHKRIARAEKAREEWKMKAVKRREENQHLKEHLNYKDLKLKHLQSKIRDLKNELTSAHKKIADHEKSIEKLKKKS